MDFFQAQEHARRNSRWLLLWFVLSVLGIIGAFYLLTVGILRLGTSPAKLHLEPWWQPAVFLNIAIAVGGVILAGSLYKIVVLAYGGGESVARDLGGQLVYRDTSDPLEQRLINVVEEMAIATGMAVPKVYVLNEQNGINAFAAGTLPSNSVIVVTRGTLERLSRTELQGVIAHEFSHILHGDMRLNMQIVGVLHGVMLLTIIGGHLMMGTTSSSRDTRPQITPLGLILGIPILVLGGLGLLIGELIKGALSREREYLADAAAVQFTRDPEGLARALQRVGGFSVGIRHPRAAAVSHMFFVRSPSPMEWVATHPPVVDRIQRLLPHFDPESAPQLPPVRKIERVEPPQRKRDPATADFVLDEVGQPQAHHVSYAHAILQMLPASLFEHLHARQHAKAAVFALLLVPVEQTSVRASQLNLLTKRYGKECAQQAQLHADWLASLPRDERQRLRLPILDLALPTLGELSPSRRATVLETLEALIRANGRISLMEFLIRRLARDHLVREAVGRTEHVNPQQLKKDLQLILGWLVRAANRDAVAMEQAFAAGTANAPMDGPWQMPAENELRDVKAVDLALDHLAACKPRFRKGILRAYIAAVEADGVITPREYELLRTISQALDCPIPLPRPGKTLTSALAA